MAANTSKNVPAKEPAKQIRLATVNEHNKADDLWIIIENKVYNVTDFYKEHPGGEEAIMEVAGTDATRDFIAAGHSSNARKMLEQYEIGELAECDRKWNANSKVPLHDDTTTAAIIQNITHEKQCCILS